MVLMEMSGFFLQLIQSILLGRRYSQYQDVVRKERERKIAGE